MRKLITNQYFIAYVVLYMATLILLVTKEDMAMEEVTALLLIIGLLFCSVAYFLTRSATPIFTDKSTQQREWILLSLLVLYFVGFITYYKELIDLLPLNMAAHPQLEEVAKALMKLIFMCIIPLLGYRAIYQFSLSDWGLTVKTKDLFNRKSLLTLFIFMLIILLFQYVAGNGAKPIREGLLSTRQLAIGLPLCFIWLILEVGLVEEFFFRSLLQSRLSQLLKSQIGGIMVSALIFGLAHAPGIYLRGGGTIANLGADPSLLMSIGYSIVTLSVAGFFLSIIWAKTKNFWLIVAIHAMVDLLPQLSGFVELWGIK